MYKAEYADGEFEIISWVQNDDDAASEAYEMEDVHGYLINLFEIDENYNEIRTII